MTENEAKAVKFIQNIKDNAVVTLDHIAYCDENDCSDCPFHNTSQKYNKCMNDFIAEKIAEKIDERIIK